MCSFKHLRTHTHSLSLTQGAYNTAKTILETLGGLLEEHLTGGGEYTNYTLVITGHSLGAGVASVLALMLKPKYKDLMCYAYSPPGCVFR